MATPRNLIHTAKSPPDGLFGIAWSRIPERSLRPFADQEQRAFERINERELSVLPMFLANERHGEVAVKCLDVSPIGFRVRGENDKPIPFPGETWVLRVPVMSGQSIRISARLVWAQKRASHAFWEAGLERVDLEAMPSAKEGRSTPTFPEPCISLAYPGSGLLAYVEHPFLYQEWTRFEVVRLNASGELLLATQDPHALAFIGDIMALKLAIPTLRVKPHRFQVERISHQDETLFIHGKLLDFNRRHAQNLAKSLHQSSLADAKTLVQAGFHWSLAEMQIDVQGLSLGQDADRRVLGAFMDEKLVASLAYRLETPGGGASPSLFIEGISLKTEAEARSEVHDRLFTLAARALLLSPFEKLICHPDAKQIEMLKRAGFSFESGGNGPSAYVLHRRDVIWGLGKCLLPWLRQYQPMVRDTVDKQLLLASPLLQAWLFLGDLYTTMFKLLRRWSDWR
jgi:hypothetical protein